MTLQQIESKDSKTITDPLMEPFFIQMDDYCYTVQEKVTPNPKYSETGNKYIKPVGHYSNFASCITSIVKRKVNTKSYNSLKEYMDEYKEAINKLTKQFEL